MSPLIYYGLLCLAIGLLGRNRRGGVLAFALIAFFLHPLLALVLLFLSAPKKVKVVGKEKIRKRRDLHPGERRPFWPVKPTAPNSQGRAEGEAPRPGRLRGLLRRT
ncbi:MAG: hypothetical protein H6741_30445 [Alphaproteobacteria bacterium]|nr:hypothetical protein [Alphaproteobacteria bacterium]